MSISTPPATEKSIRPYSLLRTAMNTSAGTITARQHNLLTELEAYAHHPKSVYCNSLFRAPNLVLWESRSIRVDEKVVQRFCPFEQDDTHCVDILPDGCIKADAMFRSGWAWLSETSTGRSHQECVLEALQHCKVLLSWLELLDVLGHYFDDVVIPHLQSEGVTNECKDFLAWRTAVNASWKTLCDRGVLQSMHIPEAEALFTLLDKHVLFHCEHPNAIQPRPEATTATTC